MQTSHSAFAAVVIGLCALVLTTPLRSQVPDCTQYKQEESHSKAPLKPIVPTSKLLHFCSPSRIPGRFFVKVKDNDDLAKDVPPLVANELEVLPGLVPNSKEKCTALGRTLAEKYHARFSNNYCTDDFRVFMVWEISDSDAATMAQDPRIEYMEPDMTAIAQ